MGHHQEGIPIGVDQVPQSGEVFKIQEYIRLVHDEKAGTAQHLTDDLYQLVFAAGEGGKGELCLVSQLCQTQLAVDIHFIMLQVHGVALVQKGLIALQEGVQILSGLHLGADIGGFRLQMQKVLTQIGKDRHILILVPLGKLAHIAHAAHAFQGQLSIIEKILAMAQKTDQSGLSRAVAADQGAVAALFQRKGDFVKQVFLGEPIRKFFGTDHSAVHPFSLIWPPGLRSERRRGRGGRNHGGSWTPASGRKKHRPPAPARSPPGGRILQAAERR